MESTKPVKERKCLVFYRELEPRPHSIQEYQGQRLAVMEGPKDKDLMQYSFSCFQIAPFSKRTALGERGSSEPGSPEGARVAEAVGIHRSSGATAETART